MEEIKNRADIAKMVNEKITIKNCKKTDIVKNIGISRHSVYKIIQSGGRFEDYSIDKFFKICEELGIKIYVK